MTTVDFAAPDVARALEQLSQSEIDELPFGVIHLSADGIVKSLSKAEALASGYGSRPALSRHFFEQVAPCMNTPGFRGRIEAESRKGELDLEFGHTGDFADPSRLLRVRVCSAADGGYWVLIQR